MAFIEVLKVTTMAQNYGVDQIACFDRYDSINQGPFSSYEWAEFPWAGHDHIWSL